MFECRIKKEKFPKEGEVVIGKIISLTDESISVELLEYNNLVALILNPETSKRKLKSLSQMSKIGSIEAFTVSTIDKNKSFIDLCLKKPSADEINHCKEEYNKNKLVYQIMSKVAKLSNISVTDLYNEWGYEKMEQYENLYIYFSKAKEDLNLLAKEKYGDLFKKVITDQFKASSYKVRIDVDVTCALGGLKALKSAFLAAIDNDKDLDISLLKSPIYSIVKISGNKEEAFNSVNTAAEIVKNEIEKLGGTFSVVIPAKLYGEKSKHTLLENVEEVDDSDEDSE